MQQERTRQGDTLLHTPRELVGTMTSEVTQTQQGEQLEGALSGLGTCLPSEFYRQQDIVEYGAPGEQYRTLKDKTDLAPGTLHNLVPQQHAPGRRGVQPGDKAQQGGFPTATLAHQRYKFTSLDRAVDLVQRPQIGCPPIKQLAENPHPHGAVR